MFVAGCSLFVKTNHGQRNTSNESRATKLGFNDFSCRNTACTDPGSFDRTVEIDLDLLEVGEETAQSFSNDL